MYQKFHQTNRILWAVGLIFMVIISAVVFYLDSSIYIKPSQDQKLISDVSFIAALVITITIFIFKRSFFQPVKLVYGKDKVNIKQVLITIRRRYLIIWVLAEVILLLGFIQYLMTVNIRQFIILGVVSLYSLTINYPQKKLAEKCEEYLTDV